MTTDLMTAFWVTLAGLGVGAFGILGVALLVKYGSAMIAVLIRHQGTADQVVGPEPAFKQYFFHKAWVDYRSVVDMSIKASWDMLESAVKVSSWTERGCMPAGNMIVIGAAAGVLTGAAVLSVVGLLHLLAVAVTCAAAMVLACLCRLLEYGSMLWRRIFMVCPHAGCYRRIALPIYVCSTCGAQHKQLIPGPYGTFHRRCQCGTMLPTLFLLGRNRLPSLCPHEHCRRPLSKATGVLRNLHIPIVGGPTAGKSSLLAATMVELSAQATAGLCQIEFPEKKDERLFAACRESFAHGQLVAKTAEYSPNAFLAAIGDRRGKRALVYAYDAAGELYQGTDEIHGQEYYSYIHGIMLVIDPYSLPEVHREGEQDLQKLQQSVRPSAEPPEAVYGRMVDTLRGFSGQTGPLDQPLAVVLTKIDALGGRDKLPPESQSGDEEQVSTAVSKWLAGHGAANLLRTIDKDFKDVKYFACSALGHIPDASASPFVPVDVLRPFAWLVGHYGLLIDVKGPRDLVRDKK